MRKAAAPPPPKFHNGTGGSISTDDSDSLSGESLEGSMELSVELPIGKTVRMSVEKRTPMMDLLVQVAKANGLNPGSYVLEARNESNSSSIIFKPNTPIGSLTTSTVYVVPKAPGRDAMGRQNTKSANQPFEKTFRLRVHLPRNQLFVQRVSQNTPLIEIFHTICTERELNSSKYEFRHPVHTEERLDLQRCLADYGLAEVAMVAVKGPNGVFSRSSSDIMALQREDDRKKRGFFGFMYRKSKSTTKSVGDTSSDGHSSRGVSPARSDGSGRQSISPPPSTAGFTFVNGASKTTSKKRAAPVPPQSKLAQSKYEAPKSPRPIAASTASLPPATTSSHSRHSSDSSGYHEASVLSESPETTLKDLETQSEFKLCNVPNKEVAAPSLASGTVNSSVSGGLKKRKAPPPPKPISSAPEAAPTSSPLSSPNHKVTSENSSHTKDMKQGVEVQRQNSDSSHASSISEKSFEKTPVKSTPIPVPLPRSSRSHQESKPNVESSDKPLKNSSEKVDSDSKSDNLSASQVAESEATFEEVPDVENNSPIDEPESVSEVVCEVSADWQPANQNREESNLVKSGSQTSNASVASKTTSEVADQDSQPKVNDNHETGSHQDDGIGAGPERVVNLEKEDGDLTDDDSLPSSLTFSRRSSGGNEEVDDGLPFDYESKMSAVDNRQEDDDDDKDYGDVADGDGNEEEERTLVEAAGDEGVQTFSPAFISDAVNEFYNENQWQKNQIAQNWAQLASATNEEFSGAEEWVASDIEEMFNFGDSENDESNDTIAEDKSERPSSSLLIRSNGERLSSDSSYSENASTLDKEQPQQDENSVKESEVNALNAQIDQSLCEHKIVAEIEEAFASIDVMESGSDSSEISFRLEPYEAKKFDPEKVWESEVGQAPKQLQKRGDEVAVQTPKVSTAVNSRDKKTTSEIHPRNYPFSDVDGRDVKEESKKQDMKIPEISTTVDSEKNRPTRMVQYQKPVVNFSISSYKSRVEIDDGYHHKAVKTDEPNNLNEKLAVVRSRSSTMESQPTSTPKTNGVVPKPEAAPGQASSVIRAIRSKNEVEDPGKNSVNELNDVITRLRKTKSEIAMGGNQPEANVGADQDRLQQEYLKLHQQFLQWQQQLLQNQTVLQQQNILPESSSETLQRLQELNQQFFSLPLQKPVATKADSASSEQSDYAKRTQSLPRPKSVVEESAISRKTEITKVPSFGPRPWRPVSMSPWKPRTGVDQNPKIEIEETSPVKSKSSSDLLKRVQSDGDVAFPNAPRPLAKTSTHSADPDAVSSEVIPKEITRSVSVKQSVSAFNMANTGEKPVKLSRPISQTNMFSRCPVVKGFSIEPQKTSKILITNAVSKKVTSVNGSESDSQVPPLSSASQASKPGVVRVNISAVKPAVGPSNTSTNRVNSKLGTTSTTASSETKRAPVVGRLSAKPAAQTFTYFGDKIDTQMNNNSELSAAQKIARTTSLKKPVSYNFNSASAQNDDENVNNNNNVSHSSSNLDKGCVTKRQNLINSLSPPPPPPPPELATKDTNGAGLSKEVKRPTTMRVNSAPATDDFKSELMLAIRDFGGRSGLKKVSSSESDWQHRYGSLN